MQYYYDYRGYLQLNSFVFVNPYGAENVCIFCLTINYKVCITIWQVRGELVLIRFPVCISCGNPIAKCVIARQMNQY